MPWWGWMIFGAFLLGSELLAIDAAFYLVFIGFAAILTGVAELIGLELEFWAQWVLFAGLSLVAMVLFRKQLYEKIRGGGIGFDASPTGDILKLKETLQPAMGLISTFLCCASLETRTASSGDAPSSVPRSSRI